VQLDDRDHCARCGGRLEPPPAGLHRRCLGCGQISYRNPTVGVAVVLLEGDSILLGRRTGGPWSGRWCIPCGHVDWGEDIRDAARREMKEETGLIVEIGPQWSPSLPTARVRRRGVAHGRVLGGVCVAGDGLDRVGDSALQTPPPLAFPTDATVIADLTRPQPA
jgi:8-oxo-dGTP pyrophosphatase MutT (NUDIX family)